MVAEDVCSTSGRSEPNRFSGGPTAGSLVRKVQPKRFVRQQASALNVHELLLNIGWPQQACDQSPVLQVPDEMLLQVPDEILLNEALNEAIAVLPANYSFEVCSAQHLHC